MYTTSEPSTVSVHTRLREACRAWGPTLIGMVLLSLLMSLCTRRPGDTGVYFRAASLMLTGGAVYDPQVAWTYPPFFALLFAPFLPLSGLSQRLLWFLANSALLVLGVRLLARGVVAPHLAPALQRRFWLLWGVGCGVYLLSPWLALTHDLVIFLLVVLGLYCWSQEREYRAAVWLGLAAACKATPLLFLPFLLWQRRWRAAALLLLVLGGATLLPDQLLPQRGGQLWVGSWIESYVGKVRPDQPPHVGGAWARWNILNQGLTATLYRLSTAVPPEAQEPGLVWDSSIVPLSAVQTRALSLAAQLVVLAALGWICWPRAGAPPLERWSQGAAVLCAMLLLSPMSSKPHFCTLAVPIAVTLTYLLTRRRDGWLVGALAVTVLLGWLTSKDLLGAAWNDGIQSYGSYTWAALAGLAAMGRVTQLLGREEQPAAERPVLRTWSHREQQTVESEETLQHR